MYLKTRDYTLWIKESGGERRYFVKYHGQVSSETREISLDVFALYVGEFYVVLEKQRNERRRHIEHRDVERLDKAGRLTGLEAEDEDRRIAQYDIEAALKTCTPIQRRRFKAHYFLGYTMTEIARVERKDLKVVSRSIAAALKKVKKYFSR